MSKARVSVGNYRVDFVEGSKVYCFGFFSAQKAFDKYVEGIAKAYDEVLIFDFAGGPRSAVLLASHSFRKGKAFNGRKEEIKKSKAAPQVRASH